MIFNIFHPYILYYYSAIYIYKAAFPLNSTGDGKTTALLEIICSFGVANIEQL